MACKGLKVGDTIALSGLTGHYQNATGDQPRGDASGSVNLQVTSIYARGCVLSITGGSFSIGSTNAITGGTIILNRGGHSGNGWGTTSSGSFLIQADGIRGSTTARVGAIGLDFKTGSSEFLVFLHSP